MRTIGALLIFLCALAPASAETLITSLSSHRVLISSNYTGTSVVLFGAIERDAQTVSRGTNYDIAITVRGPGQYIVVREKELLGPLWINQEQQKFPRAPAYLAVLTSRPIEEMTSDQLRLRQRAGLRTMIDAPDFANERSGADKPFRDALYRLKVQEGLYLEGKRGVTFMTPNIFRSGIPLPATAPPGTYEVEIALFADTVILAKTTTSFELVKTGFEQQVGEVARDWSLLYGIATALTAIIAGWLANVIFRRD